MEPAHWLIQIKERMVIQFNKYLTATSFIALVSLVVIALVVPVVLEQNEKIAAIEEHLSREMISTDRELQDDLRSLQQNMSRIIAALKHELTMIEETANMNISLLQNEIHVNKEKLLESQRVREEMAQELEDTKQELQLAIERIESLKVEQNQTMQRVSILEMTHEELSLDLVLTRDEANYTKTAMNARIDQLEESLGNTTEKLELRVSDIERDISILNDSKASVAALNDGLEGKVDVAEFQQEVTSLSQKVEHLETSTVNTEQFQQLHSTVQDLVNDKADKQELTHVRNRVVNLEYHRATKTELNNVENELKSHISSSDGTHTQLTNSIDDNSGDIDSNKQRLHQLEENIGNIDSNEQRLSQLEENSGSKGLTTSWTVTGISVSLALVFFFYWTKH